MSHPYFDGQEFPWHRDDAVELLGVLTNGIGDQRDIELCYRRSGSGLLAFRPGNAQQMWTEALANMQRARTLESFCRLLLAESSYASMHSAVHSVMNAAGAIVGVESAQSDDESAASRPQPTGGENDLGGSIFSGLATSDPPRVSFEECMEGAVSEIERILGDVVSETFLAALAEVIREIDQEPKCSVTDRRNIAEKLMMECHVDELLPRLVPLAEPFPEDRHRLAEVLTHVLSYTYDREQVMSLRSETSSNNICFFSAPTMTVAECVAAGYDGRPIKLVLSGRGSVGESSLLLTDSPPTEGPDAELTSAVNVLKGMILSLGVESESLPNEFTLLAERLASKLKTRQLRNRERTSYGLVQFPQDGEEGQVLRLAYERIYREVNKDRDEQLVLIFGEIVQVPGKQGMTHRDLESHIQFLLGLSD